MPGSERVGPAVYVDALVTGMPPELQGAVLAAIDALAPAAASGAEALAEHERTPEFGFSAPSRSRRSTATSSRPGKDGPGAWAEIDFNSPLATRLTQGLVVPGDRMRDRFDVVVVGSGAGGGVVAGELAQRGRDVAAARGRPAPHRRRLHALGGEGDPRPLVAAPARAARRDGELVAFLAGRCVGGTTTINTKVALRAHEQRPREVARGDRADERARRAVRPRRPRAVLRPRRAACSACASARDWTKSVHTVEPGFHALGAELEPVRSYTDANCMRCGSCLQGCPTNAGKSTMNTYIHDALGARAARAAARTRRSSAC